MKKVNFKIYLECIKDNASFSMQKGDKTLLATVKSKGNTFCCLKALKQVYKEEYWKLSVE